MSDLSERAIAEIIERVRRRIDAASDGRAGVTLRAEAELAAAAASTTTRPSSSTAPGTARC